MSAPSSNDPNRPAVSLNASTTPFHVDSKDAMKESSHAKMDEFEEVTDNAILSTPSSTEHMIPTSNSSTNESKESNIDLAANEEDVKDPDSTTNSSPAPRRNRKSVGTAGALNKTYIQFVQEAIVDLKEYRTGSSLASIKKWIVTNYPELDCDSPHFNARINVALKNGLNAKKFVKVRCSYKLAPEFRNQMRNQKRKKGPTKKPASTESNGSNGAKNDTNRTISEHQGDAAPSKESKKSEARARHIADRLRRRRFPMEDTQLHKEDKEFGVKPPSGVLTRPHLPYFWTLTVPLTQRATGGKTNTAILTASKVEGCDYDSRGLVPDLLQIYHFFRGDVHFTLDGDDDAAIVPHFSLKQLIHCVEQVWNGNARKAKLIPPLLVHLFVTCLQILTHPPPPPFTKRSSDDAPLTPEERQLRLDLAQYLAPALSAASWPDVTFFYMDAMHRFYTSDVSRDPNVLQPLLTDAAYLFGRTAEPSIACVPVTPHKAKAKVEEDTEETNDMGWAPQHPLPPGYTGYLGDERSALFRAHAKLARLDPWNLSAEELLALLRALTEDILATHPAVSSDLAQREEELFELQKVKKAAELKFRRIRLAYEGPKKPSRAKPKAGEENKNGEALEETEGGVETATTDNKPFQPTATKKQFDIAAKALEKANDAYEKGIRNLVARTVPVGYDRHFNAVYCFPHDPEVLYVEDKKPPNSTTYFTSSSTVRIPRNLQFQRTSWHVIETTSLCDKFAASLDIRGRREHDLCEALMGPSGSGSGGWFRHLHDDLKEKTDARSRVREKELLLERLEAARIKCDEENGRRSGRLAGQAELEFMQIQTEMEEFEKGIANKRKVPAAVVVERDYYELTGYNSLVQFETSTGGSSRRATRETKVVESARKLPLLYCSKLHSTGNIDGTGLIGMLVSSMLDLEEHCNSLAAWDRIDMSRSSWITRLENAVSMWHSMSPDQLAESSWNKNSQTDSSMDSSARTPQKRESIGSEGGGSISKRPRKMESPGLSSSSQASGATIVSLLKQPLLDLEERVADITNVALATKDADLADDNMSVDSTTDNAAHRERLESEWKRHVHKLRHIPSKRQAQIRAVLVEAIAAARKAHLQQVMIELRACLLMFRPNAPSDSKVAAIQVLVAHGDYEANEEDDNEVGEAGGGEGPADEATGEDAAPSVLSAEAAILRSSLGGSDDARREDWVSMVKSAKTISRLATLTTAFIRDAMEKIEKVEVERDELVGALQTWSKAEERQSKQRGATKAKANAAGVAKDEIRPSEVWANVRYTDQICMAKTDEYPWWPAKVCEAKDPEIAKLLRQVNRSLVAFIGEMGSLRVVKSSQLQAFTGKAIEEADELSEYTKDIRSQLEDCMAMARRIQRGLAKVKRF
jgi:linker histone H1 and H5 family/PWWP domain/Williams-Beuren syndrome DDT (WSD), D-TOX E motif